MLSLLDDFCSTGALTRNRVPVVVGLDERRGAFGHQGFGDLLTLLVMAVVEHDLGTQCLDAVDFGFGGITW